MKVTLNKSTILSNLSSEEESQDDSPQVLRGLIRLLKALAESLERGYIEVSNPDGFGAVYSGEFGIIISKGEYKLFKKKKK